MANNRLYIGNKKTKEKILIAKGWGDRWDWWKSPEDLVKFIEDDIDLISESEAGEKTSLVIFSEYDDIYDFFFNDTEE